MISVGSAWPGWVKRIHVLTRSLASGFIIGTISGVPLWAQPALCSPARTATLSQPAATAALSTGSSLEMRRPSKTYASHRATVDYGVDATGHPVVYGLHNTEAALGTRTQALYGQNATGLFLNGSSRFVSGKLGLWDGGRVLTSHREFGGRVTMRNTSTTLSPHATHMAGTLVAAGVTPEARGMAYGASLSVWDYTNDVAELTAAAPDLLVSVHAYGPLSGWVQNLDRPGIDPNQKWEWWGNPSVSNTEDYLFGFYSSKARDIDRLLYANPSLLMVRSADNKRAETGPPDNTPYFLNSSSQQSTLPRSRNDAYDVIPGEANAKNILTVGAGEVTLNSDNEPTRLTVAAYSGWGPTDDGRIKPDLLGVGTGVYSTLSADAAAYGTNTGTSMAAANVAGSLLLIQELYARQTNGQFLRSATLKGLAIHTADRLNPDVGPDYRQGWGLLNTAAAAAVVQNASQAHLITEATLTQNQVWTTSVVAQGGRPLVVTICWTDPEGSVGPLVPASLNNRTPKLVNDLDLSVVTGGQVSLPFVLNPAQPGDPATRGNNSRDNVEQVYIANPLAGQTYTVQISHKGTLQTDSQPFTVIASGRQHAQCLLPNLTLLPKSDTTICAGSTLTLKTKDVPGNRYEWLRDGFQVLEGDTPEFAIQEAGTYALRYKDRNGCTGLSTPVNVQVFSPAVQLSPSGPYQFLCLEQRTVSFIASTATGATLTWLRDGLPLTGRPVSATLTVNQEGKYQAQVTQKGCVARSPEVTLLASTVNEVVVLPADDVIQLPVEASLRLQAPTGIAYQYQWFRDKQLMAGATDRSLLVSQPGVYRLRVNQQQCVGWSEDKTVRHSVVTSVDDPLLTGSFADSTFVAYPNPAPVMLSIRYQHPDASQVSVAVYSVDGRVERAASNLDRQADGVFTLTLPVTDLPAGLHLLRLTDGPRRRSLRFIRR